MKCECGVRVGVSYVSSVGRIWTLPTQTRQRFSFFPEEVCDDGRHDETNNNDDPGLERG